MENVSNILLASKHRLPDPYEAISEAINKFKVTGDVLSLEDRSIYMNLTKTIKGKGVLDVGCGCGFGTAMLAESARIVVGTDTRKKCVELAQVLYPGLVFGPWDIERIPYHVRFEVVIAIGVLDNVENVVRTISNLLDSAVECIYFSFSNRMNTNEIMEVVPSAIVLDWENFAILGIETVVTPVVYMVTL